MRSLAIKPVVASRKFPAISIAPLGVLSHVLGGELTYRREFPLCEVIETHFLDWSEYAYRGQRCTDWPPLSKFDRALQVSHRVLKQPDPYADIDHADRALVEQAIELRAAVPSE